MTSFTLPYWYDLHVHLRQDKLLAPIIKSQLDMGCAGVLGMPITILLDRQGREIARLQGEAKWDGPEAKAILKQGIEAVDAAES